MKTLIATFLLLVSQSILAVEPYLDQTDVFPAGMNGITLYRIPGIAVTTKGTVLAYCEARKNSKSDWGEIEVHLRRSTDGGKTWEPPQQLAHHGHGIQIKSGRLVVPIWIAYGQTGDHKPSASGTIYSDDHGKTWQAGDLAVPNEGEHRNASETILTELSNGQVLLVARTISTPNRKVIALSPDGAHHWTTPVFHDQLWEPVCMAGLVTHPSKPGTIVFSNPHSLQRDSTGKEVQAGRGKRQNLSIKLSRDDGKTWPVSKTLEKGSSAYSDLAVLPDGTILCLYEGENKMVCTRFNLEWIESP